MKKYPEKPTFCRIANSHEQNYERSTATIHSRYNEQFLTDLKKHNEQYSAIDFVQLHHKNHDRFLITLPLCSGFKRKKGFYMMF